MATLSAVDLTCDVAFDALMFFASDGGGGLRPLAIEKALVVEIIGATATYLHGAEEVARVPCFRDACRHNGLWQRGFNQFTKELLDENRTSLRPLSLEVRRALQDLTRFSVYCNGRYRRYETKIRELIMKLQADDPSCRTLNVRPITKKTRQIIEHLPTQTVCQLEAIGHYMQPLVERDLAHFQRGTR